MKRLDLTGQKFNRWYVLGYAYTENRVIYWECVCDCGTIKSVQGCALKNGASKSCGCWRKEVMTNKCGEKHNMFGKIHSEESKMKMSKSRKGRNVWNKGLTGLTDNRIPTGKNCYQWNINLTDEDREDKRYILGYKEWRKEIYERDNYTCQVCGDNKGGNFVAHHMNGWDLFIEERLLVENGITLCEPCHNKFHKLCGYGNNTKEQYTEFIKGGI